MNVMEHTYAVIMAGGGGTRLWPVSRNAKPKQLLPIIGNETLFQSTANRLKTFLPADRILVVTAEQQAIEMMAQEPDIPNQNFLIEPQPKGTAAVIALAAAKLYSLDEHALMIVLPADHFIKNTDLFRFLMFSAAEVAKEDYLVTLGIAPSYPATAYGYIQHGEKIDGQFIYPTYKVLSFKEKPDAAIANDFLRRGDYSWNSGIFIWKASSIISEFSKQMPELIKKVTSLDFTRVNSPDSKFSNIWSEIEVDTIDYGIMENAKNVVVLPAGGLGWSDVGSWQSVFEVMLPDENGNVIVNAEQEHLNTNNSMIYRYGKNGGKLIVTIGLDDVAIIETDDVLLVCRIDESQKVKDVVLRLKNENKLGYL